jgi:hypothetical protein
MTETKISVTDALRGQQEQLKRLTAQEIWITEASTATLSEIMAQITELKRQLEQLEAQIKVQLAQKH